MDTEHSLVFDIKALISGGEELIETKDLEVDSLDWISEFKPIDSLKLSLVIEKVEKGILITLHNLAIKVAQECPSCLTEFDRSISLDKVTALYSFEDDESQVVPEEYLKGLSLNRQILDTRPLLRDNMLLIMSRDNKCRTDCQGLCQNCGSNRNINKCDCLIIDNSPNRPLSGLSSLWKEETKNIKKN